MHTSTVPVVNLGEFGTGPYIRLWFWDTALKRDLHALYDWNVVSDVSFDGLLPQLGAVEMASLEWLNGRFVLLEKLERLVLLNAERQTDGTRYSVSIAAPSQEHARMTALEFFRLLPPLKPSDPGVIPMKFWALSKQHGPVNRQRYIAAPTWADVASNYTDATRRPLQDLIAFSPPFINGQLILFHGRPGTGKTYAIRALAKGWRRWCDTSYILDPEKFFGEAEYMLTVLLDIESEMPPAASSFGASGDGQIVYKDRWHLLIVEDADELLTIDAKIRVGQSFARLLNLVEGIVGQGLRILVLMTTNEQVERMHPAVTRIGRCLADIKFREFAPEEGASWLRSHGLETGSLIRDAATLADLYGMMRQPAGSVVFLP